MTMPPSYPDPKHDEHDAYGWAGTIVGTLFFFGWVAFFIWVFGRMFGAW